MAVRVSVVTDQRALKRLDSALSKLRAPGIHAPVRRFLLGAAYMVLANAADSQIIRGGEFRGPKGPRGGKGKLIASKPHPSRLTSRTGELRRSLSVDRGTDRSGLPRYIDVGSDLAYAPVHELGLRGYPRRAFLEPAVVAVSGQFEALALRELEREIAPELGT